MENEIIIETPSDSLIAAFGVSSRRPKKTTIIVGALLASAAIIIGFFCFLLSPLFILPKNTVALFAVSPKHAASILTANNSLPTPWKEALRSDSNWPVYFGLAQQDHQWIFFVLGPRFALPKSTTNDRVSRLVRLTSSAPMAKDGMRLHYASLFAHSLRHPSASLFAWIDPGSLIATTDAHELIYGYVEKNHFITNAKSTLKPLATIDHDVNFSLPNDAMAEPSFNELLHQIAFGRASLANLPLAPTEVHLSFGKKQSDRTITLTFPRTLIPEEQANVFAFLGITNKQIISMPDGSLAAQQFPIQLPNDNAGFDTAFGHAQFHDKEFSLTHDTSSVATTTKPRSCPSNSVVANFSPLAITRLLGSLGMSIDLLPPTNIYLSTDKHQNLSVCFE